MTSFTSSLLSVGILLSSMFVTIGVMFVLLKHRDRTVKLPVDREQLQRIPAFGLLPLHFKDGRLCFSSWTETKPIEQVIRQAIPNKEQVSQWLTKATGQQVFSSPVLVFPGWYVTSQTKPPFPILNHKQLVKTIPAVRTQTLSQQQVDAIVYQVAQRCLSKSEVGK
ncbi:hypothetical protein [Shewanella polaris]|uniref:NERD domain-containing protein n=1 Tax=Shewanella polaris TaxID=2588449 RepID=A0A4Y5YBT0_9GAMM|nr:hypothetical protein [Shewanella polaris]QDE30144.1 hypothetical protein FH971_03635 [Shewanella polaris]